ncbi:hypothetical protein D9M70_576970 [compost metagenome]
MAGFGLEIDLDTAVLAHQILELRVYAADVAILNPEDAVNADIVVEHFCFGHRAVVAAFRAELVDRNRLGVSPHRRRPIRP